MKSIVNAGLLLFCTSLNIFIFIFKIILNGFDFFPFTVDPDTTLSNLRKMCANESVLMSCKRFIDVLDGVDLPIDKVCKW